MSETSSCESARRAGADSAPAIDSAFMGQRSGLPPPPKRVAPSGSRTELPPRTGPYPLPAALASAQMRSPNQWTLIFAGSLLGFLLVIDLGLIWVFDGSFWSEGNAFVAGVFSLIVLGAGLFQLFRMSGDGPKVATMLGGTPVGELTRSAASERARAALSQLAAIAGVSAPELFIQRGDARINAFAAGRSNQRTVVCISQGALDRLTDEEMRGVLAHEISHLKNDDVAVSIRLSATLFGLLGTVIIGLFCLAAAGHRDPKRWQVMTYKEREEQKKGEAFFLMAGIGLVTVGGLGWLAAALMDAKISRSQELQADAQAVRLTGSAAGLVGALEKLVRESGAAPATALERSGALNPIYFRGATRRYWFDSHPPLLVRIRALDPARAAALEAELKR